MSDQAIRLEAEIERLYGELGRRRVALANAETENARLKTALAFARSVIKSGEKWSDECERLLNASAN